MLRSVLLILSLLFLSHFRLQACSCVYVATFCETIEYGDRDTLYHDLIIYGTVTAIRNEGMDVAVAERLHGTDNRSFIFVRSGNGADCGENMSRFKVGQQLILALNLAYNYNRPPGDEYSLSICGINWLLVEDGYVKGPIAPGKVFMPYNDFKRSSTCSAFKAFNPTGPNDPEIKVYPNPVRDLLFVEVGESLTSFDYIISDIHGRELLRGVRKELEAESLLTIELPIEQLSSGMYFFRIFSNSGNKTIKVMVLAE